MSEENPILITWLNDFVFCPRSIYFHNLYGDKDNLVDLQTSVLFIFSGRNKGVA